MQLHNQRRNLRLRPPHRLHLRLRHPRLDSISVPRRRDLRHFHPVVRVRRLARAQHPHPHARRLLSPRHRGVRAHLEVDLGVPACRAGSRVRADGVLRAGGEPDHHAGGEQRCGRDEEDRHGGDGVCGVYGGEHYRAAACQDADCPTTLPRAVDGVDYLLLCYDCGGGGAVCGSVEGESAEGGDGAG